MSTIDLTKKSCKACEGGVGALDKEQITYYLPSIQGWQLTENNSAIHKEFKFKNFYQVMSFMNAVAWVANQENHHPDVKLSYTTCSILFTTHAVANLTENDFICAAKIEQLVG